MLFNAMVTKFCTKVWGDTISLNAWNEIEKMEKMFLRRQLGVKSTTSYQSYALGNKCSTSRYISATKGICQNHILPYLAWNVGCKKNQKSKILSSSWVVEIKKWFKRWDVEDLLELSK